MITNLGALSISNQYGRVRIEQIWGPVVSIGFARKQSIGVTTWRSE